MLSNHTAISISKINFFLVHPFITHAHVHSIDRFSLWSSHKIFFYSIIFIHSFTLDKFFIITIIKTFTRIHPLWLIFYSSYSKVFGLIPKIANFSRITLWYMTEPGVLSFAFYHIKTISSSSELQNHFTRIQLCRIRPKRTTAIRNSFACTQMAILSKMSNKF